MNQSIFWARLLGLYSVILALWCYCDLNHLTTLMIDLSHHSLIMMCLGIFTVPFGLAIIVSHTQFHGWPIFVTLMGYLITLKGLFLLFFPQWVSQAVYFWQDKNIIL